MPHKSDIILARFDFETGLPKFFKNNVKLIGGLPTSFVNQKFGKTPIEINLDMRVGNTIIGAKKLAFVEDYVNEKLIMNPFVSVTFLKNNFFFSLKKTVRTMIKNF